MERLNKKSNKALHLTAIPLRSIAAGELRAHPKIITYFKAIIYHNDCGAI